jgi:hypothetical protein
VAEGARGRPPEAIRKRLHEFARRECPERDGFAFVRSACEVYREGLFELYPAMRGSD